MSMEPEGRRQRLRSFLEELLDSDGVSAAVGLVATRREVLVCEAAGLAADDPAIVAAPGTFFDLASLTKPVVATLAVVLDQSSKLALALPVGAIYPQAHPGLRDEALGRLLRHRSGLAAWSPLYARCRSRSRALDLLLSGELMGKREERYSDLGYILWGLAAEDRLGAPLSQLLSEHLFAPLSITQMAPSPGPRPNVARCHLGNDKEVAMALREGFTVEPLGSVPHGAVQDGNARFLGGMAGHSGLFGTAHSLWRLGREWLAPRRVLRPADVAEALEGSGRYVLGWWWRRMRGHAGKALSPQAFGMVGYTGCSCWLDPSQNLVAVLLMHRRRGDFELKSWRRRFHRLAAEMVSGEARAAAG